MYEYIIKINGERYNALFENHSKGIQFLNDLTKDGEHVEFISCHYMTVEEILQSQDFEWSYIVEVVGSLLLPNSEKYTYWTDMEYELRAQGIIK